MMSFLLLVSVVLCCPNPALLLEIQAFQPAVVPIRAVTTLTLQTDAGLNVTSNTSLQCRFKDVTMPARLEDGFIFCDTPPMRNIEKVSVQLDVDGMLFKTKKPLYFHEPFKVSNITPSVVSPAQNIHLTVSGITCQEWMQYFVRFQTANGTKKTQQGICKDSVVTCSVPEFPPSTRLRVGLTLSNRLVEWADKKIMIQYPVDAVRSSVLDVKTDTSRKGAFTFQVRLKDRFENPISVNEREKKKRSKISVQYSTQEKPKSMKFLKCSTTLQTNSAGSTYLLSCDGAEKERIFFYPSINNVPLGGQGKYQAQTTLCPGRRSCKEDKSFPLVLVLAVSGGVALLLLLVVIILFVRYRYGRYKVNGNRQAIQSSTNDLEMEVQPSSNGTSGQQTEDECVHQQEDLALDSDEQETEVSAAAQEKPADDKSARVSQAGDMGQDPTDGPGASLESHVTGTQGGKGGVPQDTLESDGNKQDQLTVEMAEFEKEESASISTLLPMLQSTVDKLSTLITSEPEEDSKQGTINKQTDVLKQLDGLFQKIEPFCKQTDAVNAIEKAQEASRSLSLSFERGPETEGCYNPLLSAEELQEIIADLHKALTHDSSDHSEEETGF